MANMTPAQSDEYYKNLYGPLEGEGSMVAGPTMGGKGILNKLKGITGKGVLKGGGAFLAWILAQRALDAFQQNREQAVMREAIQSQTRATTPESLYYQAALPQAQQEEEMVRNALLQHLSGGVIGPSLARGERMIGG